MQSKDDMTKYWIIVVSKDHLEIGKRLGIVQANHGKAAPMKRLKPGDFIIFYSPKLTFNQKEPTVAPARAPHLSRCDKSDCLVAVHAFQ